MQLVIDLVFYGFIAFMLFSLGFYFGAIWSKKKAFVRYGGPPPAPNSVRNSQFGPGPVKK